VQLLSIITSFLHSSSFRKPTVGSLFLETAGGVAGTGGPGRPSAVRDIKRVGAERG
jgi:hypothetical protein